MKISVELCCCKFPFLRGKSISHVDEFQCQAKEWKRNEENEGVSEINGWVQISGNKEKILGSSAKTLCFNLCKKFRQHPSEQEFDECVNQW